MAFLSKPRFLVAILALYLTLAFMACFLDRETVSYLTREDGGFESLGAFYFLISSVLFFVAYRLSSKGSSLLVMTFRKNVFYFLLGVVFLVGFMEEISWGQRILNLRTPEIISQHNIQHEINIHNLQWFHGRDSLGNRKTFWQLMTNIDRLLTVFWLSFCLIVPLLHRFSATARKFLEQINLPIVPVSLGFLFLFNYAMSLLLALYLLPVELQHPVQEVKESNLALLFACVAAVELLRIRRDRLNTGRHLP